ncbi:MAG: RNA-protein complex protein Nop10 [Nanoarchaeota archaeon]
MKLLKRCTSCKAYTLNEDCACGGKAVVPIPPKYSPEDKYARYRRIVKQDGRKAKGLLQS